MHEIPSPHVTLKAFATFKQTNTHVRGFKSSTRRPFVTVFPTAPRCLIHQSFASDRMFCFLPKLSENLCLFCLWKTNTTSSNVRDRIPKHQRPNRNDCSLRTSASTAWRTLFARKRTRFGQHVSCLSSVHNSVRWASMSRVSAFRGKYWLFFRPCRYYNSSLMLLCRTSFTL